MMPFLLLVSIGCDTRFLMPCDGSGVGYHSFPLGYHSGYYEFDFELSCDVLFTQRQRRGHLS